MPQYAQLIIHLFITSNHCQKKIKPCYHTSQNFIISCRTIRKAKSVQIIGYVCYNDLKRKLIDLQLFNFSTNRGYYISLPGSSSFGQAKLLELDFTWTRTSLDLVSTSPGLGFVLDSTKLDLTTAL